MSPEDVLRDALGVVVVARFASNGTDAWYGVHALVKGDQHVRTLGLFRPEVVDTWCSMYFSGPTPGQYSTWHKKYLWACSAPVIDYCRSHCVPVDWSDRTAGQNVWVHDKGGAFELNAIDWQLDELERRLARLAL